MCAMAPLGVWMRLVRDNGGISPSYWGKLMKILTTSTALAPLRAIERMRFGHRVARTEVDPAPVFVHGFARSGTTHLHNLLAQDPNFGFVTTFQAVSSPIFLTARGWLERLVAGALPKTRPMDNMAVSLALPQEEEVALACTSHLSPVHQVSFPNRIRQFADKFGAMRLTQKELEHWQRAYLQVLRKATLASDGRRLVLKSPANLGRTDLLRSMFPQAKFILIKRNPYVMYMSNLKLYHSVLPAYQLADCDWEEVGTAVRRNFAIMMRRYLRHRVSIPKEDLIEIKFEDLERDPMAELARIYDQLDLPDWERVREPIAEYLGTLSGYQKNRYRINQSIIDIVDRDWGFAVREWGYTPPDADG